MSKLTVNVRFPRSGQWVVFLTCNSWFLSLRHIPSQPLGLGTHGLHFMPVEDYRFNQWKWKFTSTNRELYSIEVSRCIFEFLRWGWDISTTLKWEARVIFTWAPSYHILCFRTVNDQTDPPWFSLPVWWYTLTLPPQRYVLWCRWHLQSRVAGWTFWISCHSCLSALCLLHPPKRCWMTDTKNHPPVYSNLLRNSKGLKIIPATRTTHINRSIVALTNRFDLSGNLCRRLIPSRWTDDVWNWIVCIRDTSATPSGWRTFGP